MLRTQPPHTHKVVRGARGETAGEQSADCCSGCDWYLVVEMTARMFCGSRLVTASFMASRSVQSSSPTRTSSTMAGSSPAVRIALKQDFWSILDQSTNLAVGRRRRRESKQRVSAIPVQTGTRKQSCQQAVTSAGREGWLSDQVQTAYITYDIRHLVTDDELLAALTVVSPEIFSTSRSMELVSLLTRLDPAALGWTSVRSPDLPTPWPVL